jgi:hypothetical protein
MKPGVAQAFAQIIRYGCASGSPPPDGTAVQNGVGARSLGSYPSLSVTLSRGITLRPTEPPVPSTPGWRTNPDRRARTKPLEICSISSVAGTHTQKASPPSGFLSGGDPWPCDDCSISPRAMPIILTSHGSSEAAPATSSAHYGAVRRTEPPTGDHLRDSAWPSSRLSTDHPSIRKPHIRPRRLTLSAAIKDAHPQCGRELCARARVKMNGTQEPSRSSGDGFPVPWSPVHRPAAPGPRETIVEARCVDLWRSASRLGVRSARPCARDVLRPGRGTVRHAAVATVPRHSRGEVFGSTRPAPDGRSPYRPAEAATRPPPRRRRVGARPERP